MSLKPANRSRKALAPEPPRRSQCPHTRSRVYRLWRWSCSLSSLSSFNLPRSAARIPAYPRGPASTRAIFGELPLQHHLGSFGRWSGRCLLSQSLENSLPETLLYPQLLAPVGTLPLAELFGHLPPGGAGTRYPHDPAQHHAVIVVGASRGRLIRQGWVDHLPLFVGERCSLGT